MIESDPVNIFLASLLQCKYLTKSWPGFNIRDYHIEVLEETMGPLKFIAFCFLIFAAFGAGYYYSDFSSGEPFVAYANPTANRTQYDLAGTTSNSSGEYCAILTMPKSYIPLLERLKRKKIKDVVITPARIENGNGRLTAVAEETGQAENFAGLGSDDSIQTNDSSADKEEPSIFGALAVYFLAGSKQKQSP